MLHVWNERGLPGTAEAAARELTITAGAASFGTISLPFRGRKHRTKQIRFATTTPAPLEPNLRSALDALRSLLGCAAGSDGDVSALGLEQTMPLKGILYQLSYAPR